MWEAGTPKAEVALAGRVSGGGQPSPGAPLHALPALCARTELSPGLFEACAGCVLPDPGLIKPLSVCFLCGLHGLGGLHTDGN